MPLHLTVGIEPMIRGEALHLRRWIAGALEVEDLIGEGWLAYLRAPAYTHGGALRLRIRGAMQDALRREWKALGRTPQVVRWPVYWPKIFHAPGQVSRQGYRRPYVVRRCLDCRAQIERSSNRKRCPACVVTWRQAYKRRYNHAYRIQQRKIA